MEFKVEGMVFLGLEKRVSKKTEQVYHVGNFLGSDGNIVQCMIECPLPDGLKQLDRIDVLFKVIPGRYTKLSVVGIRKSI